MFHLANVPKEEGPETLSASWQEVCWLSFRTMEIILLHFRGGHKATLLIKTNKCQPHPLGVPHQAHTS